MGPGVPIGAGTARRSPRLPRLVKRRRPASEGDLHACAFFHKGYFIRAAGVTDSRRKTGRAQARGSTILVDDPKGTDQRREMLRASGQFMGHGLTWALAVLLFLAAGAWLDSKLGSAPILMIVGAFVGGGAGFYSLYYHIVIEPRERDDDS